MSRKKELLHKFIRGFKFNSNGTISYASSMNDYVGEIGEIVDVDSVSVRVRFNNSDTWWYPIGKINDHLVQAEPETVDANVLNLQL